VIDKFTLSAETIKNILKDFDSLDFISIGGYGELLLHPEFEKVIQFTKEKKFPFVFSTNGEALTLDKQTILRESLLKGINLSLNSLNPQTHLFLSGNKGDLKKVMENLKEFSKKPRTYSITISMVVNRMNYKEMPDFVQLVHDLGLDMVKFIPPVNNISYSNEFSLLNNQEEKDYLIKAHDLAKQLKVSVIGMQPHKTETTIYKKKPIVECKMPWIATFITGNTVVPCCYLSHYVVGNITETPFADIWNGEKMQMLRQAIMDGKNTYCKNCTEFE
jgi:MoaA/NifB/PqqE/SkfB family radical SAM enzyme